MGDVQNNFGVWRQAEYLSAGRPGTGTIAFEIDAIWNEMDRARSNQAITCETFDPAADLDEMHVRPPKGRTLEAVFPRRSIALHFLIKREVRTPAAAGTPALATEAIDAVTGERPHIVKRKDRRRTPR